MIRSKETERESDWQDIALLQEVLDARNFAAFNAGQLDLPDLLANLHSHRGMDQAIEQQLLADHQAIARCSRAISFAFLLPFVSRRIDVPRIEGVDANVMESLQAVEAGSTKHFALVEIVRRAYKRHAMDIDRADKQRQLDRS